MTQRIRTLFTRSFWADAGERALKSAAQAVLGAALVADRNFPAKVASGLFGFGFEQLFRGFNLLMEHRVIGYAVDAASGGSWFV